MQSYHAVAQASMIEELMASGHFGLHKSHKRKLQHFWWPTCIEELKNFIGNCDICLKIKPQKSKYGALGV